MKQKKYYIAPLMEETKLSTMSLLALSGAEQTDMGVFPNSEQNAGNALANPFRSFGF